MGTARRHSKGRRPNLQLELLEQRCVLSAAGLDLSLPSIVSSLAYSGAGLAAAEVEDGNQSVPAWIVGEGADTLADAPPLSITSGSSLVLLGFIGNSLLLDAASQQNDLDAFRLDVTATGEVVVQFDLVSKSAGSSLDPALTIIDSAGHVLASWEGSPASADSLQRMEVYRSIGLRPGSYYVLVGSYSPNPPSGSVGLSAPLSTSTGTGRSTGAYALRVRATQYTGPVAVQSVLASQQDHHTPVTVSVTFSGQVDPNTLGAAVVVKGADGQTYELIWTGYDASTKTATYIPASRLASGSYTVVFDSQRLRDLAGHELVGLEPTELTIGTQDLAPSEGTEDAALPVDLGYLYANEVHGGITITGFGHSAGDTDTFLLTLPGKAPYTLQVTGETGVTVVVRDAQGNVLLTLDGTGSKSFLAGGGPISVEVVSQGVGSYSVGITADKLPEVPITLNLPVPDLKISMTAPGPALPAVPPVASADPAVRFATDPTVDRVLKLMESSRENSGEVGQLGRQELPRQERTSAPFATVTPPLMSDALFPATVDARSMDSLLGKDALRLEQQVSGSLRGEVEMSSVEAIAYAIRTLWTPSPVENPPATEIDWGEIVRELHEQRNSGSEFAKLASHDPEPAEHRAFSAPELWEQSTPPTVQQPEVTDQAEVVAAAVLGTGMATTPPVRRSLAALLYRIANWLAS